MRASVASISKKFISTFFAATLALGLVPAAAFAAEDNPVEAESSQNVIPSKDLETADESQDESVETGFIPSNGEDRTQDDVADSDDSNLSIPAALERINEDVALTQPVAQQESTRSYFLAQTLESTKTVPIVSANLPLDKGTIEEVAEPDAEGEGSGASEDEGGEDSDESDLPTSNIIAADSIVIGSFEYNGIIYAMEPGGETVAAIAADYNKLPSESIEAHTIVIPSMAPVVSAYGIDYFSVTRIADYAFASLTSEAASDYVIPSDSEESALIEQDEGEALTDSNEDAENEESSTNEGITILGIPSSVTSISDEAFAGFDTLQYIVVEEGNPNYASYDGALYSADLTNLRLIPEGRVGTVRVAPSATTVEPEAFSHCPSVDTVVADPEGEAYLCLKKVVDDSIRLESRAESFEENMDLDDEISFSALDSLPSPLNDTSLILSENRSLNNAVTSGREIYVVIGGTVYSKVMRASNNSEAYATTASTATYADPFHPTGQQARESSVIRLNGGGSALFFTDSAGTTNNANYMVFGAHQQYTGITQGVVYYISPNSKLTLKGVAFKVNEDDRINVGNLAGQGYYVIFFNGTHLRNLSFNGNGGTPSESSIQERCGYEITLPTATRSGYNFSGWWTAASGGANLGAASAKVPMPSITPISGRDLAVATTYYAHWSKKASHTVALNKNGGSGGTDSVYYWPEKGYTTSSASETVIPSGSAIVSSLPTNPGYDFKGYYSASSGGTQYVDKDGKLNSTAPALGAGTTWYAQWTKKNYSVTLNKNGGSGGTSYVYYWRDKGYITSTSSTSVIASGSSLVSSFPAYDGHDFAGYFSEKTGGTKYVDKDGKLTSNAPKLTDNATWYAQWTSKPIYTITLDSQLWNYSYSSSAVCSATSAGTTKLYYWVGRGWFATSTPSTSDVGATTATNLITAPTLNGYTFGGYWTTKTGSGTQKIDGRKLTSIDEVSASATWYAKWTIKDVYTITLNSQLWKNSSDASAVCSATTAGTTAIYFWVGVGWFDSSKSQGANPSGAANTSTALITAPTLSGYTFGGYWTTKTGTITQKTSGANLLSTEAVSANGTWFAKWTIKSVYTITLNSQLWPSSTATSAESNAATPGTAHIYYWDGVGWFNTAKLQGANPTGAASTTTALITAPTLYGYDFKGYNTSKAGSGNPKIDGTKLASIDAVSSASTWYAKWEKKGNVSVFLKNDKADKIIDTAYAWPEKGIVLGEDSKELATKDNKTYLTPQADGWSFRGYYSGTTQMIDANGKLTASGLAAKPSSATTWTSQWDKLGAVAISLVNDKTNKTVDTAYYWPQKGIVLTSTSQTLATKTNKTYAKSEFEGYKFTGYYSNGTMMVDADGHLTDAGLAAAPSSATEWRSGHDIKTFTVTWKHNAASGKADVIQEDVPYGSEVAMIPNADNPGYNFVGWELSYPNGSAVEAKNVFGIDDKYTMKDKGAVVFTEKWSRSPYTTVNLVDDYLEDPNAAKTIYHWPGQGYVTSESSTDVKKGDAQIVTGLPDMTAYGYRFLGWYSTNVQNDNDDDKLMIDRFGNLKTANQPTSTTWYAHWSRTDCPVDLMASYAPSSDADAFAIENADAYLSRIPHAYFGVEFSSSVENGKLTELQLPKRTGYTFMGYYTQKNTEVSVKDAKAGSFKGTQWIDKDGTLSKNVWNETPAKMEAFTLYAAWRLDECEVTFDLASNVEADTEPVAIVSAPAKTTWSYGKAKRDIPAPGNASFDRNGYTFGGWYYLKDANGQDVESNRRFVSDSESDPTPPNWDVVKTSVTLYPAWTPKTYTIKLDANKHSVGGPDSDEENVTVLTRKYDQPLDLSDYEPSYLFYTFENWYAKATDQLFEGAHMTANADGTKRFTPRGMVAQTNPIEVYARWMDPGKSSYTLYVGKPGGTELVSETQHEYKWTETIVFNGTEAPALVENYRFVGWVWVESDDAARKMIAAGGPKDTDETWSGFGPNQTRNHHFVAKWAPVKLSLTLQRTQPEDDGAWLVSTDILESYEGSVDEGVKSWEETCDSLNEERPDLARVLHYDTRQAPFVLPDVIRKGQTFLGWKLKGSPEPARRGAVVRPDTQDNAEMRDLVYVPVFKDAIYKIVLDGQGIGEDQEFPNIAYSESFTFPYPATLNTGSVFACWSSKPDTNSNAAEVFFPLSEPTPLAPVYDETGNVKEDGFGLAQLAEVDADGKNIIRVYAVWNSDYHVDVPLFANLAIDTERGDVIAGTNTIAPDDRNKDTDATYRIESIRYEPLKNDKGVYAFQREGNPTDKVYLSVYAGLNTGDATDLEHLLYADYVDEKTAELTYTDASGETAKAKPLLIELGGTTPVVYGRTAPENQVSLAGVTDADAPYGFVTFSASNPLTIRYGLYFENPQTRKDFAFGSGKYDWLLPKNDGANKSESGNPDNKDFGRRNAWSGDTVDIAKLHYTVSLVSATK